MFTSSQGSSNCESEPLTPVDQFAIADASPFLNEDEEYLPFDENDPPSCEHVSYSALSSQSRISTGTPLQALILDDLDRLEDALSDDCGDVDWLSELDNSFDDVDPFGFYQDQPCDDHDVIL